MLRVDTGQWYTITYESIIETAGKVGSILKLGFIVMRKSQLLLRFSTSYKYF